ncbi:MAG: GNAT family N-acetyltransferase [Nostoc sp.]|uniref:GNAT family N-acetyltransferase n=1 Tax=Nostoc sp. TaxID=1180 RepID=UPI002FFC4058
MYTLTRINNFGYAFLYGSLTYPLYRSRLQTLTIEGNTIAIGASVSDKPVGLVLAEILGDGSAKLLSIFVEQNYRCLGIGAALLNTLEEELTLRDCTNLEIVYTLAKSTTLALERLLQKCNWPSAKPRMLICKTTTDDMINAPWMKLSRLPAAYEIFPWMEITPQERVALKKQQEEKHWMASDAIPFDYEQDLEPINSIGLRYKGEVVGWLITHRTAPDTIRYTCSYVRPDIQRMGRIIPLYIRATQLQMEAGISRGTWTVSLMHTSMIAFVKKHMGPYLISLEQSMGSSKSLTCL